jgi:predicted RNA-binding protein YlqC (UPF0109 family)
MKKLLEYIITSLVSHPQDVKISQGKEGEVLVFTIKVHPEDLKILIGKKGQTIKAIREVLKIKAIAEKKIINIKIEE